MSRIVSAAPSSSGGGLLTLFPCSSVGCLSWGSALQEFLQLKSFPCTAVLHELLQRGLSHGVTAFFEPRHLLPRGVLHGLQGNLCSTVNLHGLQGDSLPSHHGLQGNLCSGAPPPSPSSLTSVSAWLFLSHPTPLSTVGLFSVVLFPLLKYAITEALPLLLMGSALARGRSDLEVGKLLAASHRSHPCSPSPAAKPLPHKPNTPTENVN